MKSHVYFTLSEANAIEYTEILEDLYATAILVNETYQELSKDRSCIQLNKVRELVNEFGESCYDDIDLIYYYDSDGDNFCLLGAAVDESCVIENLVNILIRTITKSSEKEPLSNTSSKSRIDQILSYTFVK